MFGLKMAKIHPQNLTPSRHRQPATNINLWIFTMTCSVNLKITHHTKEINSKLTSKYCLNFVQDYPCWIFNDKQMSFIQLTIDSWTHWTLMEVLVWRKKQQIYSTACCAITAPLCAAGRLLSRKDQADGSTATLCP